MTRGAQRFRDRQNRQHARLLELGTEEHYLDTALYDFEYAERDDDLAWYEHVLDERVPVPADLLELGAGTGRITVELATAGYRVHALDRMPSMLAALEQRATARGVSASIHRLDGDMRHIPLADESVDAVLAPFNALMHLYTWQDLLACFRDVHRVLRDGGDFIFDVQLPDLDWLCWDGQQRHAVTRFTHPTTGEKLVYSTNHDYDAQTQICHIRIFYDHAPPRGRKFRPPPTPVKLVHLAHRQIFPEELRLLVHCAGFELHTHAADFSDRPLREGHEAQVVIARKVG